MQRWLVYAYASMVFAGFTAVIGKLGLRGISGELGIAVRTVFVALFVLSFAAWRVPAEQVATLTRENVLWLAFSAVMTSLSWVFYYKALEAGDVSSVALIDKGSIVVALVLAALVLGERLTPRGLLGAALIVGGLLVMARR